MDSNDAIQNEIEEIYAERNQMSIYVHNVHILLTIHDRLSTHLNWHITSKYCCTKFSNMADDVKSL